MSYILDALKKSEQERKRGDVPGLQTVHIPLTVEQKSPRVLYGLIVILMLLLAFLVGLVMAERSGSHDEQTVPVVVEEMQNADAVMDQAVVEKLQSPLSRPARGQEDSLAEVTVSSPELYSATQPARGLMADSSQPVYVSSGRGESLDRELAMANVPYLHELEEYKQQSIPRLNFAGHVYSSSALNRSVIINGHAMSEGDSIMQGLHVEQITPGGVIFGFQGEYFRVDILQDWSFE